LNRFFSLELIQLTTFCDTAVLGVAYLYFGSRIVRKGPDLELLVPGIEVTKPAIDTTPAEFVPDERPVEAQQ
jgi:cytochrome d ubiquinol oxidase subunit I